MRRKYLGVAVAVLSLLAALQLASRANAESIPKAPDGVTVTQAGPGVLLSWKPVDGAEAYNVYKNGAFADVTLGEASTSHLEMDLNDATYYVKACGGKRGMARCSSTPEAQTKAVSWESDQGERPPVTAAEAAPPSDLVGSVPQPSADSSDQPGTTTTPDKPVVRSTTKSPDSSDRYLSDKGYSLFFESTPTEKDLGRSAKEYFTGDWSNGFPLKAYLELSPGALEIARAPDGTIAAHASASKDAVRIGGAIGNHFGPQGLEAQVVFSVEMYIPCVNGETPGTGDLSYVGHGHHWGAIPGVNAYPAGSSNRNDSWSLRVPVTGSGGNYSIYAYIPDKPKSLVSGLGLVSSSKPACDRWERLDLELIQNTPASADNGIMRLYVNGQLKLEKKNLTIREMDAVRPRGMGYYIQMRKDRQSAVDFYHRNWKIFTK